MFSQRHFIAIAAMLKDLKPEMREGTIESVIVSKIHQWNQTVESFAFQFSNDNPKFKRELFLKACNYK